MNTFISGVENQTVYLVIQFVLRACTAVIIAMPIMGAAAEIPAIPEVPLEVAASHAELIQQRAALAQERAALRARIAINKNECQAVEQGSAADARCTASSSAIAQDVEQHVQATNQFIANLNPMVVDARNVPSGLPKDLDNSIATAYANAPPGVSDRVRKGFQAIMQSDWRVAKAWFEDALNRDPSNAGLKRMVVLADYSLHDRKPVMSVVPSTSLAAQQSVPTKAEIDDFFENFREGRRFTPTEKVRNYVLSMPIEEFKKRIWVSPLQLPSDSDTEFLFDLK